MQLLVLTLLVASSQALQVMNSEQIKSQPILALPSALELEGHLMMRNFQYVSSDGTWKCASRSLYVAKQNESQSAVPVCHQSHLMPTFFLIGTNKAGTTSVFNALWQSVPGLISGASWDTAGDATSTAGKTMNLDDPVRRGAGAQHAVPWSFKEKFFWSSNYSGDLDSYLGLYPACAELNEPKEQYVGFDGTAELLTKGQAPSRIHDAFQSLRTPGARPTFLVLLRHPVETFQSLIYMQMNQRGDSISQWSNRANASLTNAVKNIQSGRPCMLDDLQYFAPCDARLAHAAHAPMLRHWLEFFDADQFILVATEDYHQAPTDVLVEIMHKLNLPGCVEPGSQVRDNVNERHPPLADEDPDVVNALRAFYLPYVLDLVNLLSEKRFQIVGNLTSHVKSWLDEYLPLQNASSVGS
mmetsp:Transcript_50470/g.93213  ORF Transcript_50470/g.93213 Transcript_50470/m.93213 type:complete len:412 (+) Transcript_50470:73-1308(+)